MILYLSSDEAALIPEHLHNDVTIEYIDIDLIDSKEDIAIRQALVKFEDPALQKFADRMRQSTSEQYKEMFEEFASMKISEEDLMEMFYLMGPDVLTAVIGDMLEEINSLNDLESVEELSEIRKIVYESYVSTVL